MVSVRVKAGRIFAVIPFNQKDRAKEIAGYRWHNDIKYWSWPIGAKERIINIFPVLTGDIERELIRYREGNKHLAEVKKERFENFTLDTAIYKRPPHEKQEVMIKNMIIDRKHGLLCDVGTGKSQAVINTYDTLYRQGEVERCLIICPMTILDNWPEEIEVNSNYSYAILHGSKEHRQELIKKKYNFYIINYAGLKVLKDYDHWKKFDMVVLDESTYIKNITAGRTKFILDQFRFTKFKYILSGTSITQSPIDIYTQFNFLDPAYLDDMDYGEFKRHYCIMGGYQNRVILGYQNMEELKRRIARHSTQFKKEDCVDLPEKTYTKRNLELPGDIRKQYKEMEEDFLMYSSKGILTADLIITKLLRMQQILSGAYLQDQKFNTKLQELKYFLQDNIHNGNQAIIWCKFIPTIKLIRDICIKLHIPYSQLYGEIKNRKAERDRFQSGESKVMIGQINTGGMGINLTAANIVIYFENTFSLQDRIQSEGRAHRIGQSRKVTYIDMIYKNTMEENILKAIKSKQDIAKYLIKSFMPGNYKEGITA